MEVIQIGNCMTSGNRDNPNQGRVYDDKGLCPTLTDMQGGGRQPMIVEPVLVGGFGEKKSNGGTQHYFQDRVYSTESVSVSVTSSFQPNYLVEESANKMKGAESVETVRIRQATEQGYAECKIGGVADLLYPTSKTRRGRVQDNGDVCPAITAMENGLHRIESVYRIRKLTEKECWRLMNFKDDDFNKAAQVNSPTQLYKQSGNSIVRNCLVAIIGQMIEGKENVYKDV